MTELTERIIILEEKVKNLESTMVKKVECEKGKKDTRDYILEKVTDTSEVIIELGKTVAEIGTTVKNYIKFGTIIFTIYAILTLAVVGYVTYKLHYIEEKVYKNDKTISEIKTLITD